MGSRVSNWWGRLGHWLRGRSWLPKGVGIGWAFYLLCQANIVRVLGSSAEALVDLQTAHTYARLQEVIGSWTAADHQAFAAHLPYDIAHPFYYTVVLAMSLAWGFRATSVNTRFDVLLYLPFLAGLCDLVENAMNHQALHSYPDVAYWVFILGFTCSTTKWAILLTGLASLPVFVVLGLLKHRKRGLAQ